MIADVWFRFVKTEMGNTGARAFGMAEAFVEIQDSVDPIVKIVSTTRQRGDWRSQHTDCIHRSTKPLARRRVWSCPASMVRYFHGKFARFGWNKRFWAYEITANIKDIQ